MQIYTHHSLHHCVTAKKKSMPAVNKFCKSSVPTAHLRKVLEPVSISAWTHLSEVGQSMTIFSGKLLYTHRSMEECRTNMQMHSKTRPSVCRAFMSWEFLQSSRQTALTTMKRPVKPTPAKTAPGRLLAAFVFPLVSEPGMKMAQ